MNSINFDEYKTEISRAIDLKVALGLFPHEPQGFILIDGFINIISQKPLGGALFLGGPTIPTVAIVGKSTGLVYTFALKILLPNIQL